MRNSIKRVISYLVLSLVLIAGTFISSPKTPEVNASSIPSIYYENGGYWNRGTYGKIVTNSGVVSVAGYAHAGRGDGTQVVCMVRSMGTPTTADDRIEYYRFYDSNENIPCNNY